MKLIHLILMVCIAVFCSSCSTKSPSVSKVVLYYIGWNSVTYKSLSCADLIGSNDFVEIVNEEEVDKLLSAFENIKRITAEGQEQVDARLCCLFFSKNEAIIKSISFGNFNEMQIDDVVFQTDDPFFRLVLSFMPSDYLDS